MWKKGIWPLLLFYGSDVEEDKQPLYLRLNIDVAWRALERIKSEDLRQNEQLMAMVRRWKASRATVSG